MSHVATIKIIIKDMAALKEACKQCGLVFKENQKTWKWFGKWVKDYHGADAAYKNGISPEDYGKGDHAIGIPGNNSSYEIGVCKHPGGKGHTLVWDFWGGGHGLEKIAGKDCSNLLQHYTMEVTKKKMKAKGYTCSKGYTTDENGEIEMVWTKY